MHLFLLTFFLLGQTSSSLSYHSETPQISTQRYNPLKDTNQDTSAPPVVNITCPNGPVSGYKYTDKYEQLVV